MASADLRRIEALLHLRDALIRFRGATSNIASQIRARIEQAETTLAWQKSSLQAEIETQRAILAESNDDDESDDAQRALEAAYEKLAIVRERSRVFASTVARYNRGVGSWYRAIDEGIPAASAFLAGKYSEAVNYQRAGPFVGNKALSSGLDGDPRASAKRVNALWSADPANANSPDELPYLPEGFSWIPISQFSRSQELPAKDDFKKVSYDEMIAGLHRLWAELIPLLNNNDRPNRALCERFDEDNNRIDRMGFVHPESLASLWDWFFNPREHIRTTLDSKTGKWGIDNGRHRLKAASDLGWKFVPGQVVQYSSGAKDG
jgi:hypothetical protein